MFFNKIINIILHYPKRSRTVTSNLYKCSLSRRNIARVNAENNFLKWNPKPTEVNRSI